MRVCCCRRRIKCRLTGAVLGEEPMYAMSPELRWTLPISQADLKLAEACYMLAAFQCYR
jgi:hypothetical protein